MHKSFQLLFNVSMVATALYAVVNYKYIQGVYRWILYKLILTTLSELYGLYSLRVLKIVANPVYHVANPVEFVLLALFFYELTDRKFTKQFILFTTIGLVVSAIANVIWLQPLSQVNSNAYLFGSALMVVYSLIYYYELYQKDNWSTPIVHIPSFWIVSGIFFLYGGGFFLMGLINLVLKYDKDLASRLYIINLFLNILLYAFTFYGLKWAIQSRKLT